MGEHPQVVLGWEFVEGLWFWNILNDCGVRAVASVAWLGWWAMGVLGGRLFGHISRDRVIFSGLLRSVRALEMDQV